MINLPENVLSLRHIPFLNSSDYASEFVCYYLEQCGGCIEFLLKSVDFRMSSKTMTVVSVAERD